MVREQMQTRNIHGDECMRTVNISRSSSIASSSLIYIVSARLCLHLITFELELSIMASVTGCRLLEKHHPCFEPFQASIHHPKSLAIPPSVNVVSTTVGTTAWESFLLT